MEPEPAPPTTPRGGRARRLTGKLGVKSTDSAQDAKAPSTPRSSFRLLRGSTSPGSGANEPARPIPPAAMAAHITATVSGERDSVNRPTFQQLEADGAVRINLNGMKLDDEQVRSIVEKLPLVSNVVEVDLGQNRFRADGAKALGVALPQCHQLHTVTLSNNTKLGSDGIGHVVESMGDWSSLTTLHLRKVNLGDKGAGLVADQLPRCYRLQLLDLQLNQIADAGAKSLAASVPTCETLTELQLDHNEITDDGAQELMGMMASGSKLKRLTFHRTNLLTRALVDSIPKMAGMGILGEAGQDMQIIAGSGSDSDEESVTIGSSSAAGSLPSTPQPRTPTSASSSPSLGGGRFSLATAEQQEPEPEPEPKLVGSDRAAEAPKMTVPMLAKIIDVAPEEWNEWNEADFDALLKEKTEMDVKQRHLVRKALISFDSTFF
jgi:hypothetical protein